MTCAKESLSGITVWLIRFITPTEMPTTAKPMTSGKTAAARVPKARIRMMAVIGKLIREALAKSSSRIVLSCSSAVTNPPTAIANSGLASAARSITSVKMPTPSIASSNSGSSSIKTNVMSPPVSLRVTNGDAVRGRPVS